jgi:hypothetical protein
MQHGFRSNRSCESQIISLAHQLAQNNDKNIQTDLIIMDFAKVLDILLIVLILRCAHACCSKNVVAIFWLLLLRCYICLGEMPLANPVPI